MFPEFFDTTPLRRAIDSGLDWVIANWGAGFEAAAYPLLWTLNIIERGLLATPWWAVIAVLVGIAFAATRRLGLPLVVLVALLFLGVLDLWEDALKTMALMLTATLGAIVISIPLGVVMSGSPAFRRLVTPVLDLMQTLPSFVYLIPAVMIFGPGKVPAVLATIVYAAPPLMRLTDLGIRLVDPDVLEAGWSFGMTRAQRLFKIQVPLALPTIFAGINQTTMMSLSMVVIASMIGAGGLGYQVLQGIGRLEVSRGLIAGLGIVALAIVFDRITQAFGRRLQRRIGVAETRL
jgi:glycine betaine/proline transport system permease protein